MAAPTRQSHTPDAKKVNIFYISEQYTRQNTEIDNIYKGKMFCSEAITPYYFYC